MAKNTVRSQPAAPELKRELPVDMSVISDERRAEITEEALAKVRAQQIFDAEQILLKQEVARLEHEHRPIVNEEMRAVRIDIALYAEYIQLDGRRYYADEIYTVPKSVYDVLMDVMARTYRHDDEIKGRGNDDFYRRSRNYTASMRTGAVSSNGQPTPIRF